MKKIKILKLEYLNDRRSYYNYDDIEILRSITDWEDVSDEDFDYLVNTNEGARYLRNNNFVLYLMPENQQKLIEDSVKNIIRDIEQEEKKTQECLRKQKEAEAKVAEKKRLKAIEKAKKLLKESGQL